MSDAHGHDHARHGGGSHAGHAHGVSPDADRGKLNIALGLIVGFMVFEVVVGLIARSLVLLADAAHMLTDAGAILLALTAMRLAARPAKGAMTYGLKRVEILSAQLNGATLLVFGALIALEGVRRLISSPQVEGGLVLAVALVGVVVNLAATWTLSKANRQSLNVEGAYKHILTDLFAFIATAIAGGVILLTGFTRADGIAALLVAVSMFYAAWGLLRDTGRVLLEAAPAGLDPAAVDGAMRAFRGVADVRDLHVWEVSSGFPALSAHVIVPDGTDCHRVRKALARMIWDTFDIEHVALQMMHPEGQPVTVRAESRGADCSGLRPAI